MKKTRIIALLIFVAMLLCACGTATNTAAETKQFILSVTDVNGNEKTFDLESDKITVGDALTEKGIISGNVGQYGLYVTTVDGITADYNTDGTYWAFYINGEYAATGVDQTEIEQDAIYAFKIEK